MATVEARRVSKQFGDVRAVDGVDLSTREGEFLVLLGPSGCGKTTLLRMIAGLERPTGGEILIGGQVVNDLPPRARRIAMVFQSYALYPHMSVFRNIAFPLKAAGMPRAEIPQKVEWAAALFGIERLLERKPRQLSGGERQRVALARAVVREPAVFLLDEPLSNLDAKLRASARDELQQFQRRIGTTTIYVTHDQVEAMGLGDRIAVMEGGRVRQIGTPAEVYDEPADTFVAGFLGSPPTNLVEAADVLVGFRPEHFLPREAHTDGGNLTTLPFHITRVEYLGADRILYGALEGRFEGARVVARLATTVEAKVQAGRTQDFAVRARELKFFDKVTGLRTTARVP
ncbi:MAG: ABC transporter [Candidatus Rokubacteria bacterium RBG_16_73_20]|nr:MAG: ABC transporter [Candidatus Rokubacteria bacterium GWA2_73_35]OGK91861.1 MAG: ABC transporter [Candidatus Rokubacteria bacterium RBG_16_73_20]HBH02349.1 ABC transporter ATP-binding protein [Candidatus Rokubacteria bacterium]